MHRMILLLVLILCAAVPAAAELRYVTDQVWVSLRPAPDDSAVPIERLGTGTRVEVLEDRGAFLKLKSAAGNVGFARSQYFVTTPPRTGGAGSAQLREELAAAQRANAALTAELEQLKTAAPTAVAAEELEKTRAELAAMTSQYQTLQQTSGDLEGILREREQLKAEMAKLTEENTQLKGATPGQSGSALQWFLAGGAVFLVGWIAGKASRQKRRF